MPLSLTRSITLTRLAGARILAVALVLASSARATTYVVATNGSGDFTNIAAAIAAAQPGDVLLVMPGSYGAFVLNKGLRIVGYGTVAVPGNASITGIPADEVAAMIHVKASTLSITDCSGAVIVQEMSNSYPWLTSLHVAQSADVRLLEVVSTPPSLPSAPAARVQSARVEIAASSLHGSNAFYLCCSAHDGGNGLECYVGSRVHLVRSVCQGGDGADEYGAGSTAGDGGYGIVAYGDLILAGGGQSMISGGSGGWNLYPPAGCWLHGIGRSAIDNSGGQVWYSGASFAGGYSPCSSVPAPHLAGNGMYQAVSPEDPTLAISGTPTSGQTVSLTLHAPPGASAILYFGRKPILVVDSTIQIEQLVEKTRVLSLGLVPAGGQVVVNLAIPAAWPAGFFLGAQAEITLPGGEVRRTNSVPMIVR